ETQVALRQVHQVQTELRRDRLVQSEIGAHLFGVARRHWKVAKERMHRIAWHQVHDHEIEHQDGEDDQHAPTQPRQNVRTQQAAAPPGAVRSPVIDEKSRQCSSDPTAPISSRAFASPSTGTSSVMALACSSSSLTGASGAPLAKGTSRSWRRPSLNTTSSDG